MAHSARQASFDKRKHPQILDVGKRFATHYDGRIIFGSVNATDLGGWIYPTWDPNQGNVPPITWFRGTQVIPLEGLTDEEISSLKSS